jgi:hypothetical protein
MRAAGAAPIRYIGSPTAMIKVARSCAGVLAGLLAAGMLVAAPDTDTRAQLSVGYSLLYQEAEGIPKLDWLLSFKEKSSEMSRLTKQLMSYYHDLADRMEKLSKEYPAVRLDAKTMPDIVGEARKALGTDQAKDFAPLVGKSGLDFEREALLMFRDALNEQRHLVGVMMKREPEPALNKFLESTKAQLEDRYSSVNALLKHRYFSP